MLQLTTARATLDDVLKLVHETTLYNFTSAQDRRTLNTAQSCLDSLRIRLEAHANTVEETVKQRQVSLVLRQRQETAEAPVLLAELSAKRKPCLFFQTSTSWCPTTLDGIQGRPPLRLQNSYQFKVQKTNPKTSLLDLLVLIMTTCPFLLC